MTQKQRLKDLFEFRRGQWISLLDILILGIAQYNARIFELRRDGMDIVNKLEMRNGKKITSFMYRPAVKEEQKEFAL